jgi:hypothetical protein
MNRQGAKNAKKRKSKKRAKNYATRFQWLWVSSLFPFSLSFLGVLGALAVHLAWATHREPSNITAERGDMM